MNMCYMQYIMARGSLTAFIFIYARSPVMYSAALAVIVQIPSSLNSDPLKTCLETDHISEADTFSIFVL